MVRGQMLEKNAELLAEKGLGKDKSEGEKA